MTTEEFQGFDARLAALEAKVSALTGGKSPPSLLEAARAVAAFLVSVDGLADYELVAVTLNAGTIRAIRAAVERAEKEPDYYFLLCEEQKERKKAEAERDEARRECERYDSLVTRTRNVLRAAGIDEIDYSEKECGVALPIDERVRRLLARSDKFEIERNALHARLCAAEADVARLRAEGAAADARLRAVREELRNFYGSYTPSDYVQKHYPAFAALLAEEVREIEGAAR